MLLLPVCGTSFNVFDNSHVFEHAPERCC
jgi:hypothetical protein